MPRLSLNQLCQGAQYGSNHRLGVSCLDDHFWIANAIAIAIAIEPQLYSSELVSSGPGRSPTLRQKTRWGSTFIVVNVKQLLQYLYQSTSKQSTVQYLQEVMINNISKLAAFFLPLLLETRLHLRIRHTDKAEIPMPQSLERLPLRLVVDQISRRRRAIISCSEMPIGVARMALKSLNYRLLPRLGNVNNSESAQNVHARVRGRQFAWTKMEPY